jgi:signal transduction histidine kinase
LVHTNAPVDADGVAPLPENQPQATDPHPAAFTTPLMQPFGPATDVDLPTMAAPTVVTQTEAKERPTMVSRGFRAAGFMIAGFPVNLLAFILIVTLFSVGVGTLVVWLGLVVLLVATKVVFGFAATNRALIRGLLGVDIPAPKIAYDDSGSFWQRYLRRLTHPQMWRNLAYLLLAFPLACFEFPLALVGVIILPVGLFVLPVVAALHILLAKALLGPNTNEQLEQKAEHLQASRARGVDAAEAERRRIERDLHDGAQQRLVAVAMGLGRAKNKMDVDPDAAKALIDEAHADAKLAVSELRDLARGIYPAVLGDRGLDAALSSLAAKCPIPVEVHVVIDPRPPAAVESTSYFIVGECLTNIAKHSGATEVKINAWREERPTGDLVVVEITDDGHGGASMRPGGGLSGLADRAATIDGVMTVVSPIGGPTVIRADLPCEW